MALHLQANEIPAITSSVYEANAITPAVFNTLTVTDGSAVEDWGTLELRGTTPRDWQNRRLILGGSPTYVDAVIETAKGQNMATTTNRRMVQIFIVDPEDSVPLDQCLVYKSEPAITDMDDQELLLNIPDLLGIIGKYNEQRIKLRNKSVKERVENLDPARLRDLKVHISILAKF